MKTILSLMLFLLTHSIVFGQGQDKKYLVACEKSPQMALITSLDGYQFDIDGKTQTLLGVYKPDHLFAEPTSYYFQKISYKLVGDCLASQYYALVVKHKSYYFVCPLLCYKKSYKQLELLDYINRGNVGLAISENFYLCGIKDSQSVYNIDLPSSDLSINQALYFLLDTEVRDFFHKSHHKICYHSVTPYNYSIYSPNSFLKYAYSFIQVTDRVILKFLLGDNYTTELASIDLLFKSVLIYNNGGHLIQVFNQKFALNDSTPNDPMLLTVDENRLNINNVKRINQPSLYDSLNYSDATSLKSFDNAINLGSISNYSRYSYFEKLDSTIISFLRSSNSGTLSKKSARVKIYSPVLPFYKRWWSKMFHYLSW